MFGFAGRSGDAEEARRLLSARGCPLEEPEKIEPTKEFIDDTVVILISPAGVYLSSGKRLVFKKLDAPFYAIGTGGNFALGAMRYGASAAEAVEIAIECDTGCGGKIDVLHLVDPAMLRPPQQPVTTGHSHPPPESMPVPTIGIASGDHRFGPTPIPDEHFTGRAPAVTFRISTE